MKRHASANQKEDKCSVKGFNTTGEYTCMGTATHKHTHINTSIKYKQSQQLSNEGSEQSEVATYF